MLPDVFRKIPARHPFGDKLERGEGDTQEGDDVWVSQTFAHDGLLVECLQGLLAVESGESDGIG